MTVLFEANRTYGKLCKLTLLRCVERLRVRVAELQQSTWTLPLANHKPLF